MFKTCNYNDENGVRSTYKARAVGAMLSLRRSLSSRVNGKKWIAVRQRWNKQGKWIMIKENDNNNSNADNDGNDDKDISVNE